MIEIKVDTMYGIAVPEGRIRATVDQIVDALRNGETVAPVGQFDILQGICVAVKRGRLSNVRFLFGDEVVEVASDGELDSFPIGFPGSVCEDYWWTIATEPHIK